MHGFPPDLDLGLMVGHELTSITYAANLVSLDFETWSISILADLRYSHDGDVYEETHPIPSSILMSAIGGIVESAEFLDSELKVALSNGWAIWLVDDSVSYESFIFRFGDRELIV